MANVKHCTMRITSIITLLAFVLTQSAPSYALRQPVSEGSAIGEVTAALTNRADAKGMDERYQLDRRKFIKGLIGIAVVASVPKWVGAMNEDSAEASKTPFEKLRQKFPNIFIDGLEQLDQAERYAKELFEALSLVQKNYPHLLNNVKKIIFKKDDPKQPMRGTSKTNLLNGIIYLGSNHFDGTLKNTYAGLDSLEFAPQQAKSRLAAILFHEVSLFVSYDIEKHMPKLYNYYKDLLYHHYFPRLSKSYKDFYKVLPQEFITEDICAFLFCGEPLKQWQAIPDDIIQSEGLQNSQGYIIDIRDTIKKRAKALDGIRKKMSSGAVLPSEPSAPGAAPAGGAANVAAEEEGRCVTGDTMLPIVLEDRRQRIEVRLKPILEVKPGDYVLSLNEQTQQTEPHRINGLLDMGVKPVYRLTTVSGRSIKTTANHPYLKKTEHKAQSTENTQWVKVSGLKSGDEIACPADDFSGYGAVAREINGRALPVYGGQHTSKLTQRQEKQTLLKEQAFLLFSFFSGLNKDAYNQHYRPSYREDNSQKQWEFFKEITCQPNSKYGFPQVSYYFGNKFSSNIVYSLHRLELYYIIKSLSSLLFLPSAFAEPVLDSGILWDKIASIEPFGYEHVYDIEVDGTHNFIANGIFAHNTYLKEGNEPGAAPAGGVTKANVNVDREPVYFHGSSATIFEFFDKTGFKILPIGKLFELQIPLFSGEMGNGASERGVNQRRVSTSASYEKAMRSYADVNYMGHLIKNSLQEYETELAKYEEELRMRKLGAGSTMYNLYKGFMANLENIIAYLKEEEAQGHSSAEAMSRFRARSFPIVFGIKKNVASRAKPVASVNIFGWLEEYAITGYVGLWEVSHIYTEKDKIDIVKEELNKLVEKMRTSGMYNEAEEVEKIKVVSFEEGSRAAPAAGASANAAAEGLCVAGDTLLPILSAKEILPHQRDPVIGTNPNNQNIELKPIVAVKSGDYVLSLNEETQQIEPHRINGLLDMGVKPVYRLTTVSGRSIKTTANHPYLVKTERVAYSVERIADIKDKKAFLLLVNAKRYPLSAKNWVKMSELAVGDEIAASRQDLSSAIGIFAGINAVNNYDRALQVKADTVFSDSEPMCSRREVDKRLGKCQRFAGRNPQFSLINNAFLNLKRKFFEFAFAARGKIKSFNRYFNQASPNSCLIFSKGTKPSLFASSIPFLSRAAKAGFIGRCVSIASINQPTGLWYTYSLGGAVSSNLASKVQSRSHNEYVSKTKYLGTPFLSIIAAALKSFAEARPIVLIFKELPANFSNACILTTSFALNLTNDLFFIVPSPYGQFKYNTLILPLSRLFPIGRAEAAEITDVLKVSDILWDKIASIEPLGAEHVYDIEVDGTHNFIANGIFAHNTYIQKAAPGAILVDETDEAREGGMLGSGDAKEIAGLFFVVTNNQQATYKIVKALKAENIRDKQIKDMTVSPETPLSEMMELKAAAEGDNYKVIIYVDDTDVDNNAKDNIIRNLGEPDLDLTGIDLNEWKAKISLWVAA